MTPLWSIGQAATQSGVSAKMIRYYESIGIIPPAQRTVSGYRQYDARAVHILRFVKRARALGFSLEDVGRLVELWRNQKRSSAEVKTLALEQIDRLETRIQEMQAMTRSLKELAQACHGDERPECPILDDFAQLD